MEPQVLICLANMRLLTVCKATAHEHRHKMPGLWWCGISRHAESITNEQIHGVGVRGTAQCLSKGLGASSSSHRQKNYTYIGLLQVPAPE